MLMPILSGREEMEKHVCPSPLQGCSAQALSSSGSAHVAHAFLHALPGV
jgi:hypothetical protein